MELQQHCAAGVRCAQCRVTTGGNELSKNEPEGESRLQRMWHTKGMCGDGVATVRSQLTLCGDGVTTVRSQLTLCGDGVATVHSQLTLCGDGVATVRSQLTLCGDGVATVRSQLTL